MRVVLDLRTLDNLSASDALGVVSIFTIAASEPLAHSILTEPAFDPQNIHPTLSAWLGKHPPDERDVFTNVLLQSLVTVMSAPGVALADSSQTPRRWFIPPRVTVRVEPRAASDWLTRRFTPSDAAKLLREPAHLVLENQRSDLGFLRALAGSTNARHLNALVDGSLVVLHGGGGGEAKALLKDLADAPADPTRWRRCLKTWVLLDRDADQLDATKPSKAATDLLDVCERVSAVYPDALSWICLQRREIESYIPDSGLRAITRPNVHPDFASTVIKWRGDPVTAPSAWALDLKKGLRGDLVPNWSASLAEADANKIKWGQSPAESHMLKVPFSALGAAELAALRQGYGDTIGEHLRSATPVSWISDLPVEYDRGPLDQVPRASLVQSILERV